MISERLGHSGVEITLNVYTHGSPGMQEQATERLGRGIYGVLDYPPGRCRWSSGFSRVLASPLRHATRPTASSHPPVQMFRAIFSPTLSLIEDPRQRQVPEP